MDVVFGTVVSFTVVVPVSAEWDSDVAFESVVVESAAVFDSVVMDIAVVLDAVEKYAVAASAPAVLDSEVVLESVLVDAVVVLEIQLLVPNKIG